MVLYLRTILAALCLSLTTASAAEPSAALALTEVTGRVYSAIGATQPPTYENAGHNNNLSVVITSDGVLVVNGGDNYLLARDLHAAIGKVTAQPVRWVVNENGQGHAFLGNSYWADQGVPIIAHRDAVEEIETHGQRSLAAMQERNREKAAGTRVVVPGHPVGDHHILQLGDTRIEIIRFGPAHSPGDISVWLPGERILIAGDIAFHQRLLGIFPDTDVAGWIESFDAMAALDPRIVVPGHGAPTDVATLRYYTQGYLQYLTGEVRGILEADGDLADAYEIDQSAYSHLDTFKELAGKNAGRLFQAMEMEFF
jgi:glyoxylase-like metal-dependent hydrolase (beta-lactamase superfamily II)